MPTLNWIGKEAVINHHHEVPFHLLHAAPELSCGEAGSGNLILEGDNLIALKALLPHLRGKVGCICIDPPYNTGKEGWTYNDNADSPLIKKWRNEVVGIEGLTLDRHDRWLCMMYPRLTLLKEFLSDDGILFVNIDDIELPHLRILLDELFPHAQAKNRLACFVWETDGNFDNQAKVKVAHEYVLAYSKVFEKCPAPPVVDNSIGETSKLRKPEIRNTIVKNGPKNPVSEIVLRKGLPAIFKTGVIAPRTNKWPRFKEPLIVRRSRLARAVAVSSGWSSREIFEEFMNNGFNPVRDTKGQLTTFVLTENGAIEAVKVRSAEQSHVVSVIRNVGSTQSTSEALKTIGIKFSYPKPVKLIQYLISMVANKNTLVLDSFAGTGTTAEAVICANEDGGERRFILVQMPYESESQKQEGINLARDMTAKRVRCIIDGYQNAKGEQVQGAGGGFTYVKLGAAIFDEHGRINEASVRFADLARHVYFSETGDPLPKERVSAKTPLLGVHNGRAVYLLYNGILKDKSVDGGNVLTTATLEHLPAHDGPKVVYAAGCRFSKARLEREGITFKQTPYAIRTR
jgi:adenine-specific DNA-methyltransferase